MDVKELRRIRRNLDQFLGQFANCISTAPSRRRLRRYLSGQISDLERKSVEPMALAAKVPPRSLQEFLGLHRWDRGGVRRAFSPPPTAQPVSARAAGCPATLRPHPAPSGLRSDVRPRSRLERGRQAVDVGERSKVCLWRLVSLRRPGLDLAAVRCGVCR